MRKCILLGLVFLFSLPVASEELPLPSCPDLQERMRVYRELDSEGTRAHILLEVDGLKKTQKKLGAQLRDLKFLRSLASPSPSEETPTEDDDLIEEMEDLSSLASHYIACFRELLTEARWKEELVTHEIRRRAERFRRTMGIECEEESTGPRA